MTREYSNILRRLFAYSAISRIIILNKTLTREFYIRFFIILRKNPLFFISIQAPVVVEKSHGQFTGN